MVTRIAQGRDLLTIEHQCQVAFGHPLVIVDLSQAKTRSSSPLLSECRQAQAPLHVHPAEARVVKLLPQCLILGLEVFDYGLLVSIHPGGEDQKEELKV